MHRSHIRLYPLVRAGFKYYDINTQSWAMKWIFICIATQGDKFWDALIWALGNAARVDQDRILARVVYCIAPSTLFVLSPLSGTTTMSKMNSIGARVIQTIGCSKHIIELSESASPHRTIPLVDSCDLFVVYLFSSLV